MKDRIVYLTTAIDCIARIQEYTQGYRLEDFLSDRKTQDAVIRNLEIIGQALKDYGLDHCCPIVLKAAPAVGWA